MPQANPAIVAFNGGEIGEEVLGRVDLPVYQTCASIAENVLPLLQGPLIKAPGTQLITQLTIEGIIRPFVFNVDDTIQLVLVPGLLQFIYDDGVIEIVGAAATKGALSDTSDGSSSSTAYLDGVTLTGVGNATARARQVVTTSQPSVEATWTFSVYHLPVVIKVGTSAGGEQILAETAFYPGKHMLSFTPGAGTYYFEIMLVEQTGVAQVYPLAAQSAGEIEIVTPWADIATLRELQIEQSADVVWFYHPEHKTRVLERRGNTSWSLREFDPVDGPFGEAGSGAIQVSSRTGVVTVTATKNVFESGHVGALITGTHAGQFVTETLNVLSEATDTIRVTGVGTDRTFWLYIAGTFSATIMLQRSFGNDYEWVDFQSYTTATTVNIEDGLDNQIVYYRLIVTAYTSGSATAIMSYSRGSTTGIARIKTYTNRTSVTAQVLSNFGKAATDTTNWAFGAWSDVEGWPVCGALFDGRHWLARDDYLWGSKSDDFEAFEIGSDDADALDKRLATGDPNVARWIEGGDRLVIGSGGAEIQVGSSALGETITPSNARALGFDVKGSAQAQAIRVGLNTNFISRSRQKLFRTVPNGSSMTVQDLTRLHPMIAGTGGFREMAYQQEPEPRLWIVREDGQLAVINYGASEDAFGWARIIAANDGVFESVCITPGTPEDEVFVVVRRAINGGESIFVEKFMPERWTSWETAWRVQCGLAYDGTPANTITGLNHLEGEEVQIFADGRIHPPRTVTSGAIELDFAASYVIVGLGYEGRWKSVKLAYGAAKGSALTMMKQTGTLGILLKDAVGGAVKYGRDFDNMDTINDLEDSMIMDAAPEPVTEDTNNPFNGASDRDPRICIKMDQPCPAMILGMVPSVVTNEN